jgi:hypothetical protein
MTDVLRELVAARNACSREQAAKLLHDDVRYWDTERGDVTGREAVADALIGDVELETIAVSGDDAVLELRRDGRYRSTEVHRLAGGVVVSIKAYFDPLAMSVPVCPSCGQPASEALGGPQHDWECRNEACPEFGQAISATEPEGAHRPQAAPRESE